ncbi:MAG: hypothetical protein FWH36_08550, partial [Lentimicrobiaceae bacterium]|nr:hypothetical protein [Lentimicrobiaceae bacterium]
KRLSEAGIPLEDAERYNEINYETALKLAVDYADAVMISDENVSKGVQEYVANSKKPFLRHYKHKYGDRYWKLYESIFGE